MAKKKKEEKTEVVEEMSLAKKIAALDALCKDVTDKGIAVAGRFEKSEEVRKRLTFRFIPTELNELNDALGGGIPRGKVTIISGAPDTGKNGLALSTIGKAQKEDPNFVSLWVESEEAFDLEKSEALYKFDRNRFFAISPSRKMAAEGVVNILEAAIQKVKPDMVVINSLKMLVPQSELGKDMEKVSVAEQARFNSTLMKKLVNLCAETDTALVIIQHLTTKIGGFTKGDPLTLAGGQAIRYSAIIILDLRRVRVDDDDPVDRNNGIKIHANVRKNHCVSDRNPICMVEYFIEYGKGYEKVLTLMNKLLATKILTRRGAYIDLLDENGEQQEGWTWYGKKAFKEDMAANPDKFEKLSELASGKITYLSEEEETEIKQEEKAADDAVLEAIGGINEDNKAANKSKKKEITGEVNEA